MALKSVINSLNDVAEGFRSEYKQHDDGKFYLDIEGLDEHHGVGALKRAKDYEKSEAGKAKTKVTELTSELETLQEELNTLRKNGIPKGDVDALESSYKEKLRKKEEELNGRIATLTASLETHLIDGSARALATEIAAKPEFIELLLPHIKGRIKLEEGDGTHVIRVLDKDGKPSAASISDLKAELLQNKAFAPILTGSKASGGGATGGSGGGGASSRHNKPFKDLSERERVEWHREDPEGFRKARDEAAAAAR